MKFVTKVIHKGVYTLHLEPFFLALSNLHSIFLKFLPLHNEYQHNEEKIVRRNGATFHLSLSDYMQWHIFARQPDNSWREALKSIKNDACILDIGANCGAFSLSVAQQAYLKNAYNFKVYAFEPNPFVFERLQQNLQFNSQLSEMVVPVQQGLGNNKGKFRMVFNKSNSGNGTVVTDQLADTFLVDITTVDNFLKENNITDISFIKIDVEGFEPFVLEGSWTTIDQYKSTLFVEITEAWFRKKEFSQVDIFSGLSSRGYQLWAEVDNKFVRIPDCTRVFSEEQINILAIYGS